MRQVLTRWPTRASEACFDHLSVVETTNLLVNGCLPDAVKNESMSPFWME